MSTLQIDFGHAKPRIVGIDLGTTNSLVAVMDLTGRAFFPASSPASYRWRTREK
jgi:molecular chaperone DnaK (HSP70)